MKASPKLEPGNAAVSSDYAIVAKGLSKDFGKVRALDGFDLHVPRGSVFALLGRNGAGKSTLMQLLLGQLDATAGTAQVLGLDPWREGVALRRQVGYIPERMPMYEWMTVKELLRFCKAQHQTWNDAEEQRLVKRFELPADRTIRALSRGNRALLSLVAAMAHEPEVVLLDECTSGMDAIARTEFDRCVVEALQDSGRTVLFASHQIQELERLCDWVGMIKNGRLLLQMPVSLLKDSVKLIRLPADAQTDELLQGFTVASRHVLGREALITLSCWDDDPAGSFEALSGKVTEVITHSLEEIFKALLGPEDPSK